MFQPIHRFFIAALVVTSVILMASSPYAQSPLQLKEAGINLEDLQRKITDSEPSKSDEKSSIQKRSATTTPLQNRQEEQAGHLQENRIEETPFPPLSRIEIMFQSYENIQGHKPPQPYIQLPTASPFSPVYTAKDPLQTDTLPIHPHPSETPFTGATVATTPLQESVYLDAQVQPVTWHQTQRQTVSANLKTKPTPIIRQFGYSFFEQDALTPLNTNLPVGAEYLLGPEDTLSIKIWGKVDQSLKLTLDKEGNIFLPRVGILNLNGVPFAKAKKDIQKALETYYVNFNISVSLENLKTIKIFILGQVNHPGAYDVSSLATLFTALYQAGGPSKEGSLRKIELRRDKKTIATVDLYDFLLKGNYTQDEQLKPFDTIFVPPIGDVVMVDGLVKVPSIFEIAPKTTAYDLIYTYAGGYLPTAFDTRHQLQRIETKNNRIRVDLNAETPDALKKLLKETPVQNGDKLYIFSVLDMPRNVVTLEGHVFRPGLYALTKDMTLGQLVETAGGHKAGAFVNRVEVYRFISEKERGIHFLNYNSSEGRLFKLEEWDTVRFLSKDEIIGTQSVKINGAVRFQGDYLLMEDMRISDLIFLAKLEEFADKTQVELYRKNPGKEDSVYPIDLTEILKDPKSGLDIRLKNQDYIFVRHDTEAVALRRITLSGQIRYPGVYLAKEGEPLSSILERAGGFTPNAFLKGSTFKRTYVKAAQTMGQTRILEEEKKRLLFDQRKIGALTEENQQLYQNALGFLENKIEDSQGRIIITLKPLETFRGTQDDIAIEDGDTLHIPVIPQTVQVVGGVQNPTAIIYSPSKTINDYILQAGSYTEFANKKHRYILKPDGSVVVDAKKVERGDTIYIPETIKIYRDWGKFFTNILDALFKTATVITLINGIK